MRVVARCVAVVLCLVSGCSLAGGGGEGVVSCAFVADYDGRRYSGLYGAEFTLGEAVGTAVLPVCDDTGGDEDPGVGGREVTAYAVAGVDPAVAIVVDGVTGTLLVALGVRGQLSPGVVRLVGRVE